VDYRLRTTLARALRQRYRYGRSYAQLYSRFRHAPIQRAGLGEELRFFAKLVASAPRDFRTGRRNVWLTTVAWTLGRWRGWLAYGVRPPI
jgi:hypothetical protein